MKYITKLRFWFFIWIRFTLISTFIAIIIVTSMVIYTFKMPSEDITKQTKEDLVSTAELLSAFFSSGVDPQTVVDLFSEVMTEQTKKEEQSGVEETGYEIYWCSIFWEFADYGISGFSPVITSGKKQNEEMIFNMKAKELLKMSLESNTISQEINHKYFIIAVPVSDKDNIYGAISYGTSIPAITKKMFFIFFRDFIPQVLLIFALITLIPGGILSFIIGKKINTLRCAAEGFLDGKFGNINIKSGKDDLGLLADVILKLNKSLPALLEDRRQAGMWEERNRVAKNLHDTIKQDLYAVFLNTEVLEKSFKKNDPKAVMVSEIKKDMTVALETARSLISTYTADVFGRTELESGIRSELEKWKKSGAINNYHINVVDSIIPDTIAEACYMIFREAAANSARHAGAECINVDILLIDNTIILRIKDNGRGLEPDWKAGFGILLMHQRAVECNGSFNISSSETGGVLIEAIFPNKVEKKAEGKNE